MTLKNSWHRLMSRKSSSARTSSAGAGPGAPTAAAAGPGRSDHHSSTDTAAARRNTTSWGSGSTERKGEEPGVDGAETDARLRETLGRYRLRFGRREGSPVGWDAGGVSPRSSRPAVGELGRGAQ